MKKIIFLLLIFTCLFFCGCSTLTDVEYGIDGENNAYMRIRVDLLTGGLDGQSKYEALNSLQDVGAYFRDELNFKHDGDYFAENPDKAYIILTKTEDCKSFEEAFEALREMLCDESLSVFSEGSFELSDTKGEYAYRINGRIDLHRVFENTYNSGISKGVADSLAQQLKGSSFSVTLSMPGNTRVYRLSLDEPTEISHEGRASFMSEINPMPFESELSDRSFRFMLYFFGIASVIALLGIIIGSAKIKNGKGKDLPRNGDNLNVEENIDPI